MKNDLSGIILARFPQKSELAHLSQRLQALPLGTSQGHRRSVDTELFNQHKEELARADRVFIQCMRQSARYGRLCVVGLKIR